MLKVIPAIKRYFDMDVTGPGVFSFRLKRNKGKGSYKSLKFLGIRDFVLIYNKNSLSHPKNYNPKMKA